MYIVDEGFDGVLIFCGVRWTNLGEDGVFELDDVDLESLFLWGDEVPVPVPGSATAGANPSLLFHLFLIPHSGVITIFVIMLRRMSSCSY